MTDEQLKQLAKQTGIPIQKIAEWHFIHGPRYALDVDGAHKHSRPKGSLAITDIFRKRDIPVETIKQWLRSGLRSCRKGNMVLVKESDLDDWMAKHPFVRRPPGRPRKSS
jgi:hypothetical protein